jgi:hypothetical protein
MDLSRHLEASSTSCVVANCSSIDLTSCALSCDGARECKPHLGRDPRNAAGCRCLQRGGRIVTYVAPGPETTGTSWSICSSASLDSCFSGDSWHVRPMPVPGGATPRQCRALDRGRRPHARSAAPAASQVGIWRRRRFVPRCLLFHVGGLEPSSFRQSLEHMVIMWRRAEPIWTNTSDGWCSRSPASAAT